MGAAIALPCFGGARAQVFSQLVVVLEQVLEPIQVLVFRFPFVVVVAGWLIS